MIKSLNFLAALDPFGLAALLQFVVVSDCPRCAFFYTIHSADHIGVAQLPRQSQRRGIIETNRTIAQPNT